MQTTIELDASNRIVTRNPSHFQHVAPGIEILTP